MQQLGHLYIDGHKVLVLVQRQKYGVSLKTRKSGEDGTHQTDEEAGLQESPELILKLLNGDVITL